MKDIHSHKEAPQPQAVINADPLEFKPVDGQFYSVGIHPWHTMAAPSQDLLDALARAARLPMVVAIGECGYDALKGGPAFRQLQVFKTQIELAEEVEKPLIIHDVKAHDIIVGLRKDLKPSRPWIIHGFRGKPSVARMLLNAGCHISFGEKFNPEALAYVVDNFPDRLLAETDESPLSIDEIIRALSDSAHKDLMPLIVSNTDNILGAV
ncbi:MAG: TatD family hydrolase [Muribaculum sp.]|nr:TatD family hydrolase [Muribaculum sp.]